MADAPTKDKPIGAAWIPWVAALLGFGFQVIWFSSQFGSLVARIEEVERRIAFIEQNGSPVLQAVRAEVAINSRRLTNLEELAGAKVSVLLTDSARQAEKLSKLQGDVDSLVQWRLVRIRDDGNADSRIAAVERQLQQIQAEKVTPIHGESSAARKVRP